MKYPLVLLYRTDNYSDVDNFFSNNKSNLQCTIFITNKLKNLNKLYSANYHILITFGKDETEYKSQIEEYMSTCVFFKWIHLNKLDSIDFFNKTINYKYIQNCTRHREQIRPKFSVFTTAYKSYEKILRVYNSLLKQTFNDWEWVIIDDSDDNMHFEYLRKSLLDNRIRLFRNSKNNGSIGNIKNEAVSLCRGKYVLEMDHDDEILPFVLKESFVLFESDESIGFIYMDFINIYENNSNFWYGNKICKGYGSYYCQKYNNRWVYVYNTPNINNITLSHLVCCPNHPRIWRKKVLIDSGNYCESLPVCDDYEIILRTVLNTKIAKISKFGYIQYMNESNNNFSLIRNDEINRLGPLFISPIYYNYFKIHEHMKTLDAYEDETYIYDNSQIWQRGDNYVHKYANLLVNNDYLKQICIIGIDALVENISMITELYLNEKNDFILLDNKCSIDYLCKKLDFYGVSKMKCYSLINSNIDELERFFKLRYLSCKDYQIIKRDVFFLQFNSSMTQRHDIININTKPNHYYLEIGIEYGHTYKNVHFKNKVGIDPDPKFKDSGVLTLTSDDFFKKNSNKKFDVIFIDGMHQVEYIINDFKNSMICLNEGGTIFIDDIIPHCHDEQLKIPKRHYFEKDILKYAEEWTGDIWKFVYYLLQNHCTNIDFKFFTNFNYRGIACIKIINNFDFNSDALEIINTYDYFLDFNKYLESLQKF